MEFSIRVSKSTFQFEFQNRVSKSSFQFEFQNRVSNSSFKFEFQNRVLNQVPNGILHRLEDRKIIKFRKKRRRL